MEIEKNHSPVNCISHMTYIRKMYVSKISFLNFFLQIYFSFLIQTLKNTDKQHPVLIDSIANAVGIGDWPLKNL